MQILHNRVYQDASATIGVMRVFDNKGELTVFSTLEDAYNAPKIDGQTRIPPGTYEIKLREDSPKARRYREKYGEDHKGMLWLQDVPGFTFVYIHVGNTEYDTEGCILVGCTVDLKSCVVCSSVKAYSELYPIVQLALARHEKVHITIAEKF